MSGQTKEYVFAASRHIGLRSKSKDWLAWNLDNVSEWNGMSTRRLLKSG